MGGKSRKGGGTSFKLIQRLRAEQEKRKGGTTKNDASPKEKSTGLLDSNSK